MSRYSSLSRVRTSQFQADWGSIEQWEVCTPQDPDCRWSVLVEISTGNVVRLYDRRGGIRMPTAVSGETP